MQIVLVSLNGGDSSSHHSTSRVFSDHGKQVKRDGRVAKPSKREAAEKQEVGSSSIEEEAITAANDSLCSDNIRSADEKGTTGITIVHNKQVSTVPLLVSLKSLNPYWFHMPVITQCNTHVKGYASLPLLQVTAHQ